jgi:phosphohistidine phosphatase
MRLFLLRHAEAAPGKKKAMCQLTPKGIESLGRVADFLMQKELIEIAEIRHSSWVRSSQTAREFRKLTGIKAETREVPLLEPLADFRILADIVNSAEENLLLVGHQPNLSMLASYLLTQESHMDLFNVKKAGLLCLEKVKTTQAKNNWVNSWQLRWMIVPRILKK